MKQIFSCTIALFSTCLIFCSGGNDLAGGAGAGNPTGVVAFSIVAGPPDAPASAKALPDGRPEGIGEPGSGRPVSVKDQGKMPMEITSVSLLLTSVSFLLDKTDQKAIEPDALPDPLYHDGEAIVVPGPFRCDPLSGETEPSLDSIRLPEASYSGVTLYVGAGEHCHGGESTQHDSSCFSITLAGTFGYEDSTRMFEIELEADERVSYRMGGAPVRVARDATTRFVLALDPNRWLDNVNVKASLDSGETRLEPDGKLVLNLKSTPRIGASIRGNVLTSGNLTAGPPAGNP